LYSGFVQQLPPTCGRDRTLAALAWAGALACVIWTQAPLVAADSVLDRDDQTLLRPLASLHGIGDYVAALRAHRVLDLQPVRDASLSLDFAIGGAVGHGVHHLVNVLLLVTILALLYALAVALVGGRALPAAVVLLFVCHPIVANSVSWISARKHLLACAFILAATWCVRRADQPRWTTRAAAVAFYLLAVLSQPIVLLWPAWLALDRGLRHGARAGLRTAAAWLPLVAAAGAANFVYYRGAYAAEGAVKLVGVDPSVSLLSLGRDVFNALCPVALATTYYPGSCRCSSRPLSPSFPAARRFRSGDSSPSRSRWSRRG
jgi:hypothetical protein